MKQSRETTEAQVILGLAVSSPLWFPLMLPYFMEGGLNVLVRPRAALLAIAAAIAIRTVWKRREKDQPTAKVVEYQGFQVKGCPRCSGVQLGIRQWDCDECGKNYKGIPSGDLLACPRCSSRSVRARLATCRGCGL